MIAAKNASNEKEMSCRERGRAWRRVDGLNYAKPGRTATRGSFLIWLDDVRFIENLPTEYSQNLMHWMNETVNAPLHTGGKLDLKNVVG